ncbi:copper amine oxidase N-terminal domain-containing protein [Acetivibrio cellulolyticus]|uniref:copper amine oxidase N-terminal domain-containing protein n=1 Tax=Acetivibrio cellulolyticus TaxID=35830 RepID=UPI0001E2C1F8|nr:copper amine oxidase N-terminal domain-containing protein [Acetivibrio cellulolyticus]
MKKSVFLAMLFLSMCLFVGNVFASSNPQIKEKPTLKVIVDGTQLSLKNTPINNNGRVLLGLRELLIALGVPNDSEHIIWNQENKTVKVVKDDKEVFLAIGNKKATVNGEEIELDTEPVIYKNSTYIPTRFVAQSLSRLVFWDGSTNSVVITTENNFDKVSSFVASEKQKTGLIHYTQNENVVENGAETYSCKYDVKSDSEKGIEYTSVSLTKDGNTRTSEVFEDKTYTYSRSQVRAEWLKESKEDGEGSILQKEETNRALTASLFINEESNDRVVLEGDSLAFAVDSTKDTYFDVLKDKSSKCHVKMEYRIKTPDINVRICELKRMEYVITGNYETADGLQPYKITKVIEYMLDDQETVPVPSDLSNSYTIPKGMNEYYNVNGGYSLYVPEGWYLPDMYDENPSITYINENDPNKFCVVCVNLTYMSEDWSVSDIKPYMIESMKGSLKNCKILKDEIIKWKGYEALRINVSGQDKESGQAMKEQVIVVNYQGMILTFTIAGDSSTYDLKSKEVTQIVDSWLSWAVG